MRLDAGLPPQTVETSDFAVRLSTTMAVPGELKMVFSENTGADEVLVRSGPLTLSSAATGSVGGPTDFDYKIAFDEPFHYDRTAGNLLVDWTILDLSIRPYFDSHAVDRMTTHEILGFEGDLATVEQDRAVVIEFVYDLAGLLMAGDANQDLRFDQLDIVRVQQAAKYLTGTAATWGEGDWDGAPGGKQGSPPAGNGFFDQLGHRPRH